jgi:hypothetical protein
MFKTKLTILTLASFLPTVAFADNSQMPAEPASENNYPRLGLSVNRDMTIDRLLPGSPAEKSNLIVGDKIVAIEGHPVVQLNEKQRVQMLVGKSGTIAHLCVQRGSKQYVVAIKRVDPTSTSSPTPGSALIAKSGASASSIAAPLLDEPRNSAIDDQFISIERHTENTDDIRQRVLRGLAYLPEDLKKTMRDRGVSIVITPTREELDGTHGGCCYQVTNKRVVVPEWNKQMNRGIDKKRIPIATLHELGHAYDHNFGRISFGSEFRDLYDQEETKVPAEKRKMLAYFLQDESSVDDPKMPPHQPTEECFASLFARKYFQGSDKMLDTLKECFPKAANFVQNLRH